MLFIIFSITNNDEETSVCKVFFVYLSLFLWSKITSSKVTLGIYHVKLFSKKVVTSYIPKSSVQLSIFHCTLDNF